MVLELVVTVATIEEPISTSTTATTIPTRKSVPAEPIPKQVQPITTRFLLTVTVIWSTTTTTAISESILARVQLPELESAIPEH